MGLCGTGPLLEATGLHHRTVQGEGTNIDISTTQKLYKKKTTQKFIRLAINKSFSNCNSVTSNFVDNGRGQKQKPLDLGSSRFISPILAPARYRSTNKM